MVRGLIITLSLFTILLGNVASLNLTEYVWDIGELVLDEHFVEEYMKWSFELFSQPDYLYGDLINLFLVQQRECEVRKFQHQFILLRPGDIKCVAAMGDSLTAGLGAHAILHSVYFWRIEVVVFFFYLQFSHLLLFYRCCLGRLVVIKPITKC